jgi:hypothetical protein
MMRILLRAGEKSNNYGSELIEKLLMMSELGSFVIKRFVNA